MAVETQTQPRPLQPRPTERRTQCVDVAPSDGPWIDDERAFRLRRLLVGADVVALLLTFLLASLVGWSFGSAGLRVDLLPLVLVGVPVWIALAAAHDLYHLGSRRVEHDAGDELGSIVQMTVLWSWSLLLTTELLSLGGVTVARVALFWVVATALLVAARAGVRAGARRSDWYVHRTLIVGHKPRTRTLAYKLARHPEYALDIVGTVDLSSAARARRPGTVPPVIRPQDVIGLATELGVNRVLLADPPRGEVGGDRFHLAHELGEIGVRVDLLPAWFEVLGARLELHEVEGTSLLTLPYVRLGRGALAIKRAFDVTIATLGVAVLLPLVAVIALAIRIDSPGPVLFRQRRVGRWGEPFELLKFRSMRVGADEAKADVALENLHGGALDTGLFKVRQDPRVTRVGSILRRTSLDELPQLWNILRGEMSVVGPRPLIETEARQVEGRYRRRAHLTPGLTGLWQVNGRSEVPFEAMINLDYLYCTTWSLWGDLKILLKTVPAVFTRRGAY